MGKTEKKFIEWVKRRELRDMWRASIYSEDVCKINLMKYKNYSYPQTIEEQIETNYFYYWQSILSKHFLYKNEIREIRLKRILTN